MKFRVDRDVLADAVAWAARSLPGPPQRPRPRRPADRGRPRRAWCSSTLRLRDLRPGRRSPAEVADEGRALVTGRLLADICRSLPGQAGRGGHRRRPGSSLTCGSARFSLLTMPVEDYPTLPDMPAATGTVAGDAFAARGRPGRRSPPAATTRCRCSPASGSRSTATTITLLATDRYRLAVRELDWTPEQPRRVASPRWSRPGRSPTPPSRWPRGGEVTIALVHRRRRRGHDRLRGRAAARRTTTRLLDGEFPKVRSAASQPSTAPRPRSTRPRSIESVKRVALVAERNTAGPARASATAGSPSRPAPATRPRPSESIEAQHRRRGHHDRASTRSSCSTASARIDDAVVELRVHPVVQAGRASAGRRAPTE